jgi:hypothetical protein
MLLLPTSTRSAARFRLETSPFVGTAKMARKKAPSGAFFVERVVYPRESRLICLTLFTRALYSRVLLLGHRNRRG